MDRSTSHGQGFLRAPLLGVVCSAMMSAARGQEPVGQARETQRPTASSDEQLLPAAARLEVKPVVHDEEIHLRLLGVLEATD